MTQNEEIRATYIDEQHRWGETLIALFRAAPDLKGDDGDLVRVKTQAEEEELVPGVCYSLYGHWSTHARYGRQFQAKTFVEVVPHDRNGIVAYLRRAGVGFGTAKRLWDKFEGDAVRRCREEPDVVVKFINHRGRYGEQRAQEVAKILQEKKATEAASIDLTALLAGRGFPRKVITAAIRAFGNRAHLVVRKDPYKLLAFNGVGFARADELYLELGHPPAALKRQTLCIAYTIASNGDGHTWFHPGYLDGALRSRIASADVRPVRSARLGMRAGLLAVHRTPDGPWLTITPRAQVELDVADRASALLARAPRWPEVDGLDVSDHQAVELRKAVQGRLAVFGGSPGTGKTYTAARLISRICEQRGPGSVAVVAPTGKAAVRISEALEQYGLPLRASTIHSYLRVESIEDGVWRFLHGPDEPVEEDFVVVDESSMIDTSLMASLLNALPDSAHLLLVGDVNQLPPVGHGAPLRDLVHAGVPAGELREIRRNAGAIVSTCAAIRDSAPFEIPERLSGDADGNLVLRRTRNNDHSAEVVMNLVRKIRDQRLSDATWETQVIVAVNEKSPLSRKQMNTLLQAELNGANRETSKFWRGDKVVCLKNGFWPLVEADDDDIDDLIVREDEDGRKFYVANGEIGQVLEEFDNKLILEFFTPRRVVLIPKGKKESGASVPFDLGYAISCHKSQGSEWPIVIVAIDEHPGARMVCDRSWLYTAISRAKKGCIMVGQESTMRQMIKVQKITLRKTFLSELLEERRAHEVPNTVPAACSSAGAGVLDVKET